MGNFLSSNPCWRMRVDGYSIDIVVEGAQDPWLAIGLDGDAYHGPERWEDDMRRQAALERAGWIFWRVFGSQWRSQRACWTEDLVSTLTRLGIEPIGAEAVTGSFTEFRHVDARSDFADPHESLNHDEVSASDFAEAIA